MAAVLTHGAIKPRLRALCVRDILALAKARLSALVLCTTGVGLWVAPGSLGLWRSLGVLVASACTVAAANMLNSYMERDSDALMHRTKNRPLPARRVQPSTAWGLGVGLGVGSLSVLYALGGPLCALLAFVAYASYAWMYTPMKRYSWLAVLVGAIPGAIPPLMGYAACAGTLDRLALGLFALMFAWQLPHFFAISIYLQEDYARGGLKVLPLVLGNAGTRRCIIATAALLVPVATLPALCLCRSAGVTYGAFALFSGGMFMGLTAAGLTDPNINSWARRVFVASVVHLSLLLLVLMAATWR